MAYLLAGLSPEFTRWVGGWNDCGLHWTIAIAVVRLFRYNEVAEVGILNAAISQGPSTVSLSFLLPLEKRIEKIELISETEQYSLAIER